MTARRRSAGLLIRLLRWLLPPTPAGRSILGDVLEESHRQPAGVRRAIWIAAIVVPIAVRYLPARVPRVGASLVRTAVDDARAGWCALRRDRATVVLAVVTLAAGIGSVAAILSAIYGSLLRPLPFDDPASLVVIGDRPRDAAPDRVSGNISLVNVRDAGHGATTLAGVAAYRDVAPTISGAGDATRVRAQEVDPRFLDVLGVRPLAGRGLTTADQAPGAARVAVVSESLARRLFGDAEAAVGRTIRIDGGSHAIVGVVRSVTQLGNPQLWVPLNATANLLRRDSRQVYAVGRLAPGGSIDAARAELETRFESLKAAYPEIGEARSVGVMSMYTWIVGDRGPRLLRLLGAGVLLVLLIAGANVSGLLLLRAERRQADLALRSALGATRSRLMRELAAEGLIVAVAAAALGLAFAAWCSALLVDLYGSALPRAWEIGLHPPVIAGTLSLAACVGLLITIVPASRLPASRLVNRATGRVTTGPSVGQRTLVWGQTAVAMVLAGLAALMVTSVARLSSHDQGLDPEGVVAFDVSVAGRATDAATVTMFFDTLLQRLERLPGVTHAAAASRRPLFGGNNTGFTLSGVPESTTRDALLEIRAVTPEYFGAIGVPLLSGRTLTAADATGAPVVVVNRTFETTFFKDTGAVDREVRVSGQTRTYQIVGVVGDLREFGPAAQGRPTAYWPFGNGPYATSTSMAVLVRRDAGDPLTTVPAARAVLRDLDPAVALDAPVALTELVALQAGRDRLAVRSLLTLAAALGILLSIVGLYSVLACALSRRVREIGIRRALGATRRGVVGLLAGQGLAMAMPGLVVGLSAAALSGRLITAYLHDVSPADPVTLGAAALILTFASLAASVVPAWRAGRIEAIEALRHD